MDRLLFNFQIAVEAIRSNKLRSFLTALGIIFGVSAVISMMAIGAGAQQEILNQMKLVGVNNIIITPIHKPQKDSDSDEAQKGKGKFSPGLNLHDIENITHTLNNIENISGEIVIDSDIIHSGKRKSTKLIGIHPSYFNIFGYEMQEGTNFAEAQAINGAPVCIIGQQVVKQFFNNQNPIGKSIKCGKQWLTVIGVLKKRNVSKGNTRKLGIRNANIDVYIPIQTMLLRYKNRGLITKQTILAANESNGNKKKNKKKKKPTIHQLDKIIVQIAETEQLGHSSEIIHRMLKRRHNSNEDFRITVPELLLKQQQKTKEIFNMVLGAIAGISLLVGGIGIMNIMLASVMERIKEIGLRIALGAQKRDIIQQFLCESMLISLVGGLIGIILGIILSLVIAKIAEIETVISLVSIITSFGVSSFIGILFGITPARKAANQNPITSLRHE